MIAQHVDKLAKIIVFHIVASNEKKKKLVFFSVSEMYKACFNCIANVELLLRRSYTTIKRVDVTYKIVYT